MSLKSAMSRFRAVKKLLGGQKCVQKPCFCMTVIDKTGGGEVWRTRQGDEVDPEIMKSNATLDSAGGLRWRPGSKQAF